MLPLGALLAVFARERTGRIDNAMALHRIAAGPPGRLESIVQNASDLIAIIDARRRDHVADRLGRAHLRHGPRRAARRAVHAHVHPDDAAGSPRSSPPRGRSLGHSQELEWRQRYADGSFRHVSAW